MCIIKTYEAIFILFVQWDMMTKPVEHKDELDYLKEKKAIYGDLEFWFSDKYIQSLKDILDKKNAFQLMVKDNKNVCAYVSSYETDFYPNFLFLNELFVDPDYQGQSTWTKLVTKVLEKAKELNLKGVVTQTESDNIPAQNLYEKMWFVTIETKPWIDGVTYQHLFE